MTWRRPQSTLMPHLPTWHTIGWSSWRRRACAFAELRAGCLALDRGRRATGQVPAGLPHADQAFAAFEQARRDRVERIVKAAARVNNNKAATGIGRVVRDLMLHSFSSSSPIANSRSNSTATISRGAVRYKHCRRQTSAGATRQLERTAMRAANAENHGNHIAQRFRNGERGGQRIVHEARNEKDQPYCAQGLNMNCVTNTRKVAFMENSFRFRAAHAMCPSC